MTSHTITGYTLRVAVIYQGRVTFDQRKNTWREVSTLVGPEYGEPYYDPGPMLKIERDACDTVMRKHYQDEDGAPTWNGLRAIGACVIGSSANFGPDTKNEEANP